jgi:hypothetical protein
LKRALRYLALGAGAYLLFLLLALPARHAAGLLERQVSGLSLRQLDGSVFSGQAGRAVLGGQELGTIRWSFRPAALLLLRIEYRVHVDGPLYDGSGNLALAFGADLQARDIRGELQAAVLARYLFPDTVEAAGKVDVMLQSLEVAGGFPSVLSGSLQWTDAAMREPVTLVLGTVDMVLAGVDDGIAGKITNSGGDVAVSGGLSLLRDGVYELQLEVKPGPQTDPVVVDALGAIGEARSGGVYLVTDKGRW